MSKTGMPDHKNKVGCKKVNQYSYKQCTDVLNRLGPDKQDNSKYAADVLDQLKRVAV